MNNFEINIIENEIFFMGNLNLQSISKLTIELVKMEREKRYNSIYLHINSPGGIATDALSLYDLICSMKIPVYTICTGETCSAGTIISMAGKIRYITPNTYMLIHQLCVGDDSFYKLESFYKRENKIEKEIEKEKMKNLENLEIKEVSKKEIKEIKNILIKPYEEIEDLCNNENNNRDDKINVYDLMNVIIKRQVRYNIAKHIMDSVKNIYLKHTKIKENEIDNILLEEGVFNAEECLTFGLADKIFKREFIV